MQTGRIPGDPRLTRTDAPPFASDAGEAPRWGLCASCLHHRSIESAKGSRFVLCERSRTDPSFPRYPRVPVVRCVGYEPAPAPDA